MCKDTQHTFHKPMSIIRNRYVLQECSGSGCAILFIVYWFLSSVYKCK